MKVKNYRLLIVLIAFGIITVFSFPAMATDVGGIIDTDTTWDLAGSPYNITSDVQIAEGATLTIEAGVVVNNGGGRIRVWGALNAIGNSISRITLNNVMMDEHASTTINIHFAIINSGWYFFSHAGGNFTLLDSKIKNTQWIQADICSDDSFIERNIFIDAGEVYVERDGANVHVKNNVFYRDTSLSVSGSNALVQYNSFLSTDRVALLLRASSTSDFSAVKNYWNTLNTSVIDEMIFDRNDDLSIPYFVDYIPFLTEPHPDTPPLDENQAPTSNSGDDQVVHDQVTLNGIGSSDPDGFIDSYDWSLQHRTNSDNDRNASGYNPTVSNLNPGFYDVYLTVTDNGGLVDVDNMLLAVAGSCFCTPSTFHIEMIEPDLLKADKGEKHGQALVKVMDDCGNAVSGATVYGTFSGDISESINGQTGGDGNVLLTTTVSTKGKPSFTFCVDDVINGTLSYAPVDNVETCDSYQ